MNDQPRDERELQTALEIHSPGWLPGLTAKLSYRRLWDKRAASFIESVAEHADSSLTTITDRIASGDRFADLALPAASRAAECGDEEYVDILSRLVAAALIEDAKIDEVAYVLDRVIKLEPIHIRVLDIFRDLSHERYYAHDISDRFPVNVGVLNSCFEELSQVGFLESSGTSMPSAFMINALGLFAVDQISGSS